MTKYIKLWIVPVLVTSLLLLLTKGAVANYVEQQLSLGGVENFDNVVVKVIDDGHDREIYYTDNGSQDIRITDNEYDDLLPVYSNGFIAWQGLADNKGWQIFVYDIATGVVRQLTYGQYPSEYVHASGNGVVWEMPKAVGSDIFYYDGLVVTRLTNDNNIDELPQTDGNYIVWQHYDGFDIEIMVYDIVSQAIAQLTDDEVNQSSLVIYNGEVFFKQFDGNDNEIFGLKIADRSIRQITNNEIDDGSVQLRNGKLIWLSQKDTQNAGRPQVDQQSSQTTPQPTPTPSFNYEEQQLDLDLSQPATNSATPVPLDEENQILEATPSASSSLEPTSTESSSSTDTTE